MAEQLYTIPVNDAFNTECECPICIMYEQLEKNAIDYTLGPSYMEDDNRAMTDEAGFCSYHISKLYGEKNRLGLALMLKTHTDKTICDMKKLAYAENRTTNGLFKKNSSALLDYIHKIDSSCFICERINGTFKRYIDTIFHLWKKEPHFKNKILSSKGFCTHHYGILYEKATDKLSKERLSEFITVVNKVYFDNMDRLNDEIGWFIDKADYRNKNESWKNSKDSIIRGIIKTNHIKV